MPRRQGVGLGHARACRKVQEATVRGLVADAQAEAHEAHAAAWCDLTGSARAFLNETALPAVRALNGAGAPTPLLAMHLIVHAIQPGLSSPEVALYGHWMEWHESNRLGRHLFMGETLRLTGAGSAMSLRSSAPALMHALRTSDPGDTAPYLNQAGATYPGGVSELDAALHLLHPPDEDLEVGEITVFVEGADEAPARTWPTNPVYDGTRPTPLYTIVCLPQGAHLVPRPPAGDARAPRLAQPRPVPPPLQNQGCPPRGGRSSGKSALAPPCSSSSPRPRGPRTGPGDHPHPPLWGSTRTPPPPPGARGAGRGTHLPANTGGHRRYGSPPSAPPPGTIRRPPGTRGPEPCPRLGAVARRVAPRLLSQCRWMAAGPRLYGADATAGPPPPPPLPPAEHRTALPTARN